MMPKRAIRKLRRKILSIAYNYYLKQRTNVVLDSEPPIPAETNFFHDLSFLEKGEPNPQNFQDWRIAYAVLIHDRYEYLVDCLETLFSSNYEGLDITFFLIDDESIDPRVRELLRKYESFQNVQIHYCAKTQSTSGAVTNRALRIMSEYSKFDLYGFGDPDCLYHPQWLQKTIALRIWLMKNYKEHKIGMISPYNSVAKEFHNWIGVHDSPASKFVVKRQMGWPSILVSPQYIKSVGLMHETPQDENIYTHRLRKLDYVNICLYESHLEHIGQQSHLNNFRNVAVPRADYSWALRKDGWGKNILKYQNPTIIRDLVGRKFPTESNIEVDVLINLHSKDIGILPTCIESVRKHLAHPILRIYVISESFIQIESLCKSLNVENINEKDILETNFPYEGAGIEEISRTGWLYQQLLKLSSDRIGKANYKFIIDADSVLLNTKAFVVGSTTFLPVGPYFKSEYMEAYTRIFHEDPINFISNVCHSMLLNSQHLDFMRKHIEQIHDMPWMEAIYANIELTKVSSFSEFETYAHYVQKHFTANYELANFRILDLSQKRLAKLESLENEFSGDFDALGFQHWI